MVAPSVFGLFKWRQFEPEVILMAVGWYLRFSLSYRDVEELLAERGLHADHVTVWRWVQRYAPEVNRRLRSRLKPTNDSWRVDSDLHPGQGQVGVFIPGCGFDRGNHRLPSLGQTPGSFKPGESPNYPTRRPRTRLDSPAPVLEASSGLKINNPNGV
jgi:hypothetical protein